MPLVNEGLPRTNAAVGPQSVQGLFSCRLHRTWASVVYLVSVCNSVSFSAVCVCVFKQSRTLGFYLKLSNKERSYML